MGQFLVQNFVRQPIWSKRDIYTTTQHAHKAVINDWWWTCVKEKQIDLFFSSLSFGSSHSFTQGFDTVFRMHSLTQLFRVLLGIVALGRMDTGCTTLQTGILPLHNHWSTLTKHSECLTFQISAGAIVSFNTSTMIWIYFSFIRSKSITKNDNTFTVFYFSILAEIRNNAGTLLLLVFVVFVVFGRDILHAM